TLIPGTAVNLSANLDAGTGTINATGGTGVVNFTGDSTVNGASFSAGTLNISSGVVTLNTPSSIDTLNLSGGTFNSAGDMAINNVLDWTGGDIYITGDYYNEPGSVFNAKAAGSLNVGTFYNNGIFTIGSSPGALTINGNYVQGSEGSLDIELGGLTQGMDYDWLNITGSATLDGTLNVSLWDNFTGTSGDQFDIMTYTSVTLIDPLDPLSEKTDFATVNIPTGYCFLVGDQGTFYQLEVTSIPSDAVASLPYDPFSNILIMVEQTESSVSFGMEEAEGYVGESLVAEGYSEEEEEVKKKGRMICR
ncbi:hypothetical protein ACFL7M_19070, partial [Thermodesulfobacteriota bacterium]